MKMLRFFRFDALRLSIVGAFALASCGGSGAPAWSEHSSMAGGDVVAEGDTSADRGEAESAPARESVYAGPAPGGAAPSPVMTMAVDTGGEQAQVEEQTPAAQSWRRVTGASRFATVALGGGATLELRRVRVSVKVEGFRARTVVDHIFYNPHARTIEGTFRYPLPPEASVSSYAMFLGSGTQEPSFFGPEAQNRRREEAMQGMGGLQATLDRIDPQAWGELRVGRIVRAEQGREVYENVTRRRVDPALVEEVAPNTFEARVFPIQANGFHRVIVSYEQTLPRIGSELEYLFPVPSSEHGGANLESFELAVEASDAEARRLRYTGDLAGGRSFARPGVLGYSLRSEGAQQGGALAFRMTPRARGSVEVLAGTNPASTTEEQHFVVRLRGDERLPEGTGGGAAQAVFMLDSSLSEDPDRFNLDVTLLRRILEGSPTIRRFNVLTFDAGARWLRDSWYTNDARGRASAIEKIEDILLEGATDLGAALDTLARPPMSHEDPRLDVFLLTDGAVSWGERDAGNLIERFVGRSPWDARIFAYRTGLGAEDITMLRRLAQNGAVFNCLSASAIDGCAVGHQRSGLRIERVQVLGRGPNGARTRDVLVAGGAATLTRGAELLLAGRLDRAGDATVRVEGTLDGQPHVWTAPVTLTPTGELASRVWAEVAVAHLLATHDAELEGLAVALGQRYRIASRATSFLVLETDAEYEQYDLSEARRDAGEGPIRELVRRTQQQRGGAQTSWERLERALRAGGSHHRLEQLEEGAVWRTLSRFVARRPVDFVRGGHDIPAVLRGEVPRRYRRNRPRDPEALDLYRQEGERRREHGRIGEAIRALSSGVENAPGSSEVARSVGYTLMAWQAEAEAAELF